MRKLRNFDHHIKRIPFAAKHHFDEIFAYENRYCGEPLKFITFASITITDVAVLALPRTLRNIREIKLYDCEFELSFLEDRSTFSPKLRRLGNFSYVPTKLNHKIDLRLSIPQLKHLQTNNVHTDDTGYFLLLNPQLKTYESYYAADSIFELVASHVPTIEELHGCRYFAQSMPHMSHQPTSFVQGIAYPQQLPAFEPPISSLKSLGLHSFDFCHLDTEITKLKTLTNLSIQCTFNLTSFHVTNILIECSRLKCLAISGSIKLSLMDLINIVKNGTFLKYFQCHTLLELVMMKK